MRPPIRTRLEKKLAAWPWRRVGVLAAGSLGLALALVLYLFGVGDHFLGRLFPAFFIFFWLLAVVFLAVVPFVVWATNHWFGRGWAAAPQPAARPRRSAPVRQPLAPVASRRPETR